MQELRKPLRGNTENSPVSTERIAPHKPRPSPAIKTRLQMAFRQARYCIHQSFLRDCYSRALAFSTSNPTCGRIRSFIYLRIMCRPDAASLSIRALDCRPHDSTRACMTMRLASARGAIQTMAPAQYPESRMSWSSVRSGTWRHWPAYDTGA